MSEPRQLRFQGVDELAEWVGRHLGYSDWLPRRACVAEPRGLFG
jgi:hypothetical protein